MRYCAQISVLVPFVGLAVAGPISNIADFSIRDEPAWAHGTDSNCATFIVPVEGDYCDKIAKAAGITTKCFIDQNPQINAKCTTIWQRTKYCVEAPLGQPGKDSIHSVDAFIDGAENAEADDRNFGVPLPGIRRGVAFHNKSPNDICYAFELARDFAVPSDLPTSATCQVGTVSYHGIIVPAGQWRFRSLGPGFQGAITAVTNGAFGARHEFAFVSGNPPGAFYNVDYEYGLSGSTLEPYDGRPLLDGRDSQVGEPDFLTKINHAFKQLSAEDQQALLTESGEQYMRQGPYGDLTWIHTSREGPHALWYFLQCQAKLRGYVMPGSEANKLPVPGSKQADMVQAADTSTGEVSTQLFLITAYPDRRHFDYVSEAPPT